MSSTIVQANPEWYTAAWNTLSRIERNASDYEDLDEGDQAPSTEVFEAVRAFLNVLKGDGSLKVEEPRMSVSPNGHLVLTYGDSCRSLNVRFTPTVFFFFKHPEMASIKGNGPSGAIVLIAKYFRI